MTPNETIAITAAFVMGLSGSAHCFGMCGGLATAFGARMQSGGQSIALSRAALPQAGRILSYMSMGAICGGMSQALQALIDVALLGVAFRALGGVLLLLVAVRLLFRWNALAPLEKLGAHIWRAMQPLTRRLGLRAAQPFLFGMIWGLLPCGMVYSMLAFATLSGSALKGAALMFAFGLGTAPSMLTSTLATAKTLQLMNSPFGKWACGVALATFGVWLLIHPLQIYAHAFGVS